MLTTGSPNFIRLALVAWTVTSGLSACSKNTPAAPAAPVAASIISTTLAANLVAPVATGIPGGVSVQVLDATGAPVSGVTVSWTAFNGGIASEAATTPVEALLMASTEAVIRSTARWVAPTELFMASRDAPA